METGKHVIFLGAGASKGSGYPLANDLRLLMSSRRKWIETLRKYEGQRFGIGTPLTELGIPFWDANEPALRLFREGGFATLDEFCKLAGPQYQNEIMGLRCLARAALGIFNPEEQFEQSEYYSLVQALFREDLFSLRDDVSILTYNYDP